MITSQLNIYDYNNLKINCFSKGKKLCSIIPSQLNIEGQNWVKKTKTKKTDPN
jgi:hypothetical protein